MHHHGARFWVDDPHKLRSSSQQLQHLLIHVGSFIRRGNHLHGQVRRKRYQSHGQAVGCPHHADEPNIQAAHGVSAVRVAFEDVARLCGSDVTELVCFDVIGHLYADFHREDAVQPALFGSGDQSPCNKVNVYISIF